MSTSPIPDPLQLLRKAVARLEAGGNALANRAMDSGEFSGALHQMVSLSLGMQKTVEKVIGNYLKKANLPSRVEVAELAQTLHRIEGKLDRLLPAEERPVALPRPARTRLPPEHPPKAAGKGAVAAAKKPAAKKSTGPKTSRRAAGG